MRFYVRLDFNLTNFRDRDQEKLSSKWGSNAAIDISHRTAFHCYNFTSSLRTHKEIDIIY